jgi:hypothetical protein
MSTCDDMTGSADKDGSFCNQIIIGDETLCFLYEQQLKQQSGAEMLPLLPRKKKNEI